MGAATIITGDDNLVPVTLKKDGATFAIGAGASVKARIVATDHESVLSAEVTQSKDAPGADWPNSLVVVAFAAGDTDAITYQGRAKVEIQVDDGGKTTWFVDAKIIRGNIA